MAEQTPETPESSEPVAFNIAAATDEELIAEYGRVKAAGVELSSKTDADPAELTELAGQLQELSTAVQGRATAAREAQAAREAFAAAPDLDLTPPASEAPATVEETPVESTPTAEPTPEPVPVPSVAQMAITNPTPPAATVSKATQVTAHVGAQMSGLVDLPAGSVYANNGQIALALIKNAQSYGVTGGSGTRQTVAQFKRTRAAELVVADGSDKAAVRTALRFARDERRLPGGNLAKAWQKSIDQGASLTAAAGWCAPSENDYDLCRNWSPGVGFLDLPTVTVSRGGINYTDEPTFAQMYANAVAAGGGSNFLTEAQVIADTVKTCSEIPCPEFENRRLDVMALCIRVSFLQAAGYPEVVDAWQEGLRAVHEAEQNRLIIADLIARAGAATVLPLIAGGSDSFTSALLAGMELAAEDTRYQFHMDWNETVEFALPHWVIPQIRADLSRRTGDTGTLINVSDSYIAALFSVRNLRVHWVRGWQDGLITGGALNPAFPGGIAAPPFLDALPDGLSFLSWPAGSVAVARQDVVTLTNVYDAASLATNEFTALFAEEGFAPIYPCPGQRLYTLAGLCPGGITGAAEISCTAPTP